MKPCRKQVLKVLCKSKYGNAFSLASSSTRKRTITLLSKKQKKKRKQQKLQEVNDSEEIGDITNDLCERVSDLVIENDTEGPAKQSNKSRKARRKEKDQQKLDSTQSSTSENVSHKDNADVTETSENSQVPNCDKTDNTDSSEPCAEQEVTSETGNCGQGDGKSQKESFNKLNTAKSNKDLKCNVCQKGFPTRNKLFDHIKQEGHAIRLDVPQSVLDSVNKKGKKKGKR